MRWMTAAEALAALGTKPQTLYANVSRGRIRARPDPADPRRSLYHSDDVRKLAGRKPGRRKESVVAAQAIRWGMPVLRSSVSTVRDGRLFYRDRDAAALAETATLEETAALLWLAGPAPGPAERFAGGGGIAGGFAFLAGRAAADLPSVGRARAVLVREAWALTHGFFDAVLGGDCDGPLHRRAAEAWGRPDAADLIRRALVLLADHELNASTFAARVAASTGAPLSAAALAGLSTLIGPRHGLAAASMTALAARAREIGAAGALTESLRRAAPPEAFGHPLYGEAGDVRANALLAAFALPPVYRDLAEAGAELLGERPNVDFALAALAEVCALPPQAPLLLFALARLTGWLAHAMEQAEGGELIRPRADFVPPPGLAPESG